MNNQALLEALEKFMKWNDEQEKIKSEIKIGDAADTLLDALYGPERPVAKLIGGSNAPILHDAAERIRKLTEHAKSAENYCQAALNATYLHKRNIGGHFYPGVGPPGNFQTSHCEYCRDCWMGGTRSGGADGVDPFGDCPGNPKLRDAYDAIKQKLDFLKTKGLSVDWLTDQHGRNLTYIIERNSELSDDEHIRRYNELEKDRDRWQEQSFRPLGDNHHNANLCPHCTAQRLKTYVAGGDSRFDDVAVVLATSHEQALELLNRIAICTVGEVKEAEQKPGVILHVSGCDSVLEDE